MGYLRFASRHIHQSVANHVREQLGFLGWTQADETPFGATPAKVISTPAVVGSQLDSKVTAGTVAVTLGDEYNPDLEEMGGFLTSQDYPIFVDIFQSTDAAALTLANDIRDIFLGRHGASSRWISVIDQATKLPVDGWSLEFDDVERITPETVMPLRWQVVKVTATAYFLDTKEVNV